MEWKVRPGERKQLGLVKIPAELALKLHIEDQMTVTVGINDPDGRILYKGPLNVTSGNELYIPMRVQEVLARCEEVRFGLE